MQMEGDSILAHSPDSHRDKIGTPRFPLSHTLKSPLIKGGKVSELRAKKPLKYHPLPLVVCACLLLFILSCSPQNRLSGYIYYRLNTNPTTLDPALIVDVIGGSLSAKLFNGLVRMNKNLDIIPDMASKWKISENGLVYRFELKKA